ncbi:hypothetical protein AAV98_12325 [Bacillus sp. CHD6a]|nr:hypothetical protein AAV98_12325 [Bacillus sp. CHD6a]
MPLGKRSFLRKSTAVFSEILKSRSFSVASNGVRRLKHRTAESEANCGKEQWKSPNQLLVYFYYYYILTGQEKNLTFHIPTCKLSYCKGISLNKGE